MATKFFSYLLLSIILSATSIANVNASTAEQEPTTISKLRGGPSVLKPLNMQLNDSFTLEGMRGDIQRSGIAGVMDNEVTRASDRSNTEHIVQQLARQEQNAQSDRFNAANATGITDTPEALEGIGMATNVISMGHHLFSAIIGPAVYKLFNSSKAKSKAQNLALILTGGCKVGGVDANDVTALSDMLGKPCTSRQDRAGALFGLAALRKNKSTVIDPTGPAVGDNNGFSKLLAVPSAFKNPSRLFATSIASGGSDKNQADIIALNIALECVVGDAAEGARAKAQTRFEVYAETLEGKKCVQAKLASAEKEIGGDAAYSKNYLEGGSATASLNNINGKQYASLIAASAGGGMYDAVSKLSEEKNGEPLGQYISANQVRQARALACARTGEKATGDGNGNDVNRMMMAAVSCQQQELAGIDRGSISSGGSSSTGSSGLSAYLNSTEFKEFAANNDLKKLADIYWDEIDVVFEDAGKIARNNIDQLEIPVMIASLYPGNYQKNYQMYVASLEQQYKQMSLNDFFIEFDLDTATNLPTSDMLRFAGISNMFENKYLYSADGDTLIASLQENEIKNFMAQKPVDVDSIFGKAEELTQIKALPNANEVLIPISDNLANSKAEEFASNVYSLKALPVSFEINH